MDSVNLVHGAVRAVTNGKRRFQGVFLTPDEVLLLLKVARDRAIRDWAMVLLAYRHGMRERNL